MDKAMPNWAFRGMTFIFRIRDAIEPRSRVLQEVQLEPGDHVLDYGCGPGAYIPGIAARVTDRGRVYAVDLHPLAVQRVRELARRRGLDNVQAIQSDCRTGLPDESVIVDPGIGIGKSWQHDLEIIRRLGEMRELSRPILLGPSSKSFIGKVLDLPAAERLQGTAAAVAVGIANGADIVRVHQVGPIVQVCRLTDAIVRRRQSGR